MITLKEIKSPCAIAACELNKCIYVSDKAAKCVWRVDRVGNIEIFILDLGSTVNLTVISGGSILTIDGNRLKTFSPEGKILTSVPLPKDVANPKYATVTPRGTYFVGYSSLIGMNHICEISQTGEILRSFCDSEVKLTFGICMDPHGQLFVLDYGNSRILLLDSHLKLKRIIMSEIDHDLFGCMYMSYDGDSGNLLISAFATVNRRIKIYNILLNSRKA